jgi:hypothetical protein
LATGKPRVARDACRTSPAIPEPSAPSEINGGTGVWAQRASAFLIPPILLLALVSTTIARPGPRLALACLSGLLTSLLLTQDFYSALFTFLLVILLAVGWYLGPVGTFLRERLRASLRRESSVWSRVALLTAVIAGAWTCYALIAGGGETQVLGVRLASRNWRRPGLVTVMALVVFLALGSTRRSVTLPRISRWWWAFLSGAAVGTGVFLWVYLGSYREHQAFPEEQLLTSLAVRDLSLWQDPAGFLKGLGAFDSMRSFTVVFALTILAWIPRVNVDRTTRLACLYFALVSCLIVLLPLRIRDVGIWTAIR